jgi:hypothetical protein
MQASLTWRELQRFSQSPNGHIPVFLRDADIRAELEGIERRAAAGFCAVKLVERLGKFFAFIIQPRQVLAAL